MEKRVKFLSKTAFVLVLISSIITSSFLYFFMPGKPSGMAATNTWEQTDWIGGPTAENATHPTNKTDWNEYSNTSDANFDYSTAGEVKLAEVAGTPITETADTDFNGKSVADMTDADFNAGTPEGGKVLVSSGVILMLPPSAPTWQGTPVAVGNAQLTPQWVAGANGGSAITKYKVYRSPDNITFTEITSGACDDDTVLTATSCVNTGLTNGTTYYYKIAAVNVIGTGTQSTASSATTPNVPSQVTGLSATSGNAQIALSWSAPASNGSTITNYKIYRSTPTNGSYSLFTTVGATTNYTNSSLTNGTAYYYKVSAVNGVGEGTMSGEVSATPQCTVVIGTQTWMCYNLNVGTKVAGSENQGTSCASVQKYCYSDNEANCTSDGGLYQWDQAMCGSTTPGTRGICPSGFHIPTDAQFKTLVEGQATAGCESSTGWQCSPAGTNLKSSGSPYFYGILAGYRNPNDGSFYDRTTYAIFWSSSQYNASNAWDRLLSSGSATVYRGSDGKASGWSVRCLKD